MTDPGKQTVNIMINGGCLCPECHLLALERFARETREHARQTGEPRDTAIATGAAEDFLDWRTEVGLTDPRLAANSVIGANRQNRRLTRSTRP